MKTVRSRRRLLPTCGPILPLFHPSHGRAPRRLLGRVQSVFCEIFNHLEEQDLGELGCSRLTCAVPQVVAVVMDLLTDLQILQDLLDAASRRGVAVYAVLEARGAPHFLDMCARLQITAAHLRVRSVTEGRGREEALVQTV